ncbi:MAG: PBP1A family penicillin-binding protein [Bauldia sp.]|nr:PBP1A family penicillin-binding protein [Bauldia sp.]
MFFLTIAAGTAWYVSGLASQLPDYDALAQYELPLVSRIHTAGGELIGEFARERRMYLPIETIPERLRHAFVSVEDQNFYRHSGVDLMGIVRAAIQNVQSYGSNERLVGGSTITQQVAKNFLLSSDQTWDRKIQEAILAVRIENAYSKDRILELYMNEVNLGLGAYGVAAGALIYFGKSVHELSIAECALLAAVLKGPSNYHPFRFPERALERRNYVIDRMVEDGYVTPEEAELAKAEPLGVITTEEAPRVFAADSFHGAFADYFAAHYGESIARTGGISTGVAGYFAEEVRRELINMYGEDELYSAGLSVRTTLDPEMQILARKTLMDGLIAFDTARGWRGPVTEIEMDGDWGPLLANVPTLYDVIEWRVAVVLSVDGDSVEIGLRPGRDGAGRLVPDRITGRIPASEMRWAGRPSAVLDVGDVIYVEPVSAAQATYRLRQVPGINGAIVAMEPETGRVRAMVGGFSFAQSQFNRATQAFRQPGSSFKPFVYAAAIDNGYTPSSIIVDAPIEVNQGPGLPPWRPENYSQQFYGPLTLRSGIELSRNVMTVRLAQDLGMATVVDYAERFGLYDTLAPHLSMALGSGETTLLRMAAGYSVFPNGGHRVTPTLIDHIQDRHGTVVFQSDQRVCEGCTADMWSGQPEPQLLDNSRQLIDPMTAYQLTSMLEGVVQRGTATVVRQVGRPLAGKTGTTNDFHDAWFVGFSPDLVVGVYLGYDDPRSLGTGNTGGVMAAPIFTEFMKVALADQPVRAFRVPEGMILRYVVQRTGEPANGPGAGIIVEAYKPAPPAEPRVVGVDVAENVVLATATAFVNMRNQPGREGQVIGVVPEGASVEIRSCSNWCEVVFDGRQGYVSSTYLRQN